MLKEYRYKNILLMLLYASIESWSFKNDVRMKQFCKGVSIKLNVQQQKIGILNKSVENHRKYQLFNCT